MSAEDHVRKCAETLGVITRMEEALGADGHQLVYVGDNPAKDFVAPNQRGWMSVQVVRPDGIHDHTRVADGGAPQHRIDSLTELMDLLAG